MLGCKKVSTNYLYSPIYRYRLELGRNSRREDICLDVCKLAWQTYNWFGVGLCLIGWFFYVPYIKE